MSVDSPLIHEQLSSILLIHGIDIIGNPIQVGEYNRLVDEGWRIEDYGDHTNLAICVGSSRAIWIDR